MGLPRRQTRSQTTDIKDIEQIKLYYLRITYLPYECDFIRCDSRVYRVLYFGDINDKRKIRRFVFEAMEIAYPQSKVLAWVLVH